MWYKSRINPELKNIAVKVPYNKAIITCANIFQKISLYLTKIPREVNRRKFVIAGYRGLACKVEIFEPSNGKGKLPALLYVHGGACIAAMICNHYEAKGLKQPCLQMLIYPLTDIGMQTDSMKKYTDTSRPRCTAACRKAFRILISKPRNMTACMMKVSDMERDCGKRGRMLQ